MSADVSEVQVTKIELPTALPYATLRNWREPQKLGDAPVVSDKAHYFNLDYRKYVSAAMTHIDSQGRVHMIHPETGDEFISFVIPRIEIPSEPGTAQKLLKTLADRVYMHAAQIIASHFDFKEETDEEHDKRDYIEGQTALAIAPYRYDPELLRQVIELVKHAQREDAISIEQST